MTDAQIITEAKGLVGETVSSSDSLAVLWLNRLNRHYCRKNDWPELKTLAATVTTTANQAYVQLAAGFERFVGKTVLYQPDVVSGGYLGGYLIPILSTGSPQLENIPAAWRTAGSSSGPPTAASLAGAAGAYKLYLYPFPTTGSITIVYDYFRAPTALTGAGVSPDVQALCDTLTLALAAEYCLKINDLERRNVFRQEAKEAYNAALSNIVTT